MLKKLTIATVFALLVPVCSQAQISINIGPPPPVVERPGPPPHPGYVWQGGYQRWDGHHYVWTAGHWGHPPHPGAVWVAPRYDHAGRGYQYHAGYWR